MKKNNKFLKLLHKIILKEIEIDSSGKIQNIFEENTPIGYESGVDITNKYLSSLDKKEIEIKKKQNKTIKKATKNINIDKKNIKQIKNLPKLNTSKTKSTSENLPKAISSLDDILKNTKSLFNNIKKNITLNLDHVKEISNALNQSIKFTSKIPYKIQSIIKNINKNLSSTGDLKKSENDLKKLYEYVKQNYEFDPYVVNLVTNIINLINKSYSSSVQLNNKKPIDDPFKGIPKAIVRDPIKTNSTDDVIKNVKDIISKTQIGKDVKNIISISKQLQSNYITYKMAEKINNEIKNRIINDGRSSYYPLNRHFLLKAKRDDGAVEIYDLLNGKKAIYNVIGNKPNLFGGYEKISVPVLDFINNEYIKANIPIIGIGIIETQLDHTQIYNSLIQSYGDKSVKYVIPQDEISISLSKETRTLTFNLVGKVEYIYVKPNT